MFSCFFMMLGFFFEVRRESSLVFRGRARTKTWKQSEVEEGSERREAGSLREISLAVEIEVIFGYWEF